MARLHGATLTIESELNVGTTASILFPAARTRPRSTAEEPPGARAMEAERHAAEERKLRVVAAE
jgi:hypothetical protein